MNYKIQIFNFHSISDKVSATLPSVPVKVFKQICAYLQRNYFLAPLSEIGSRFRTRKPIGVITFDDGFYDFYENALEIIAEKRITATQHLIVDCVVSGKTLWTQKLNDLMDAYYFHSKPLIIKELGIKTLLKNKASAEKLCREIFLKILKEPGLLSIVENLEKSLNLEVQYAKMMSPAQIKECLPYGISFGSHTISHKNLCFLSKAELEYELRGSKQAIEEITGNVPCLSLAVPNGMYNADVIEACKDAGYKYLLTTKSKSVSEPINCFELPRFTLYDTKFWKNFLKINAYKYFK